MDGTDQSVAGDLDLGESRQMAHRAHFGGAGRGERMRDAQAIGFHDGPCGWGGAFVELTLDIPTQDLEALERAASNRGITMGQFLRRLIRDCLAGVDDALPQEEIAFADAAAEGSSAGLSRGYAD